MAPIKSSLAKSAKQLLGLRNTADLGLRGATQTQRTPPRFTASGGTTYTPGNGYKSVSYTPLTLPTTYTV